MALLSRNGNEHVDRIAELKKQANTSQPFDLFYYALQQYLLSLALKLGSPVLNRYIPLF